MKTYNERKWLNKEDNPSTGSYVAFHGQSPWEKKETLTFFEVADCHEKIRLHIAPNDSKEDFILKLQLLVAGLNSFIAFLQTVKKIYN